MWPSSGTPDLWRIYRREHEPLWFGPPAGGPPVGRFADPRRAKATREPTFGVCYFGLDLAAAFAECFLRRPQPRLLSRAALEVRRVAWVNLDRPLRLVALFGPGLAVLGATAAVTHGPHDVAQRWSRALWSHPDRPDGIAYRCRHDDDLVAVALYDRAADALSAFPPTEHALTLTGDPKLLGMLLNRYGLALDD